MAKIWYKMRSWLISKKKSLMTTLVDIQNLTVSFGKTTAVRDVSFKIKQGEIVCLVGESGSGKSVSALALMGLLPDVATKQAKKIEFDGKDLMNLSQSEFRKLRGREMSMIFQEPMTSLNPVFKVGEQVAEVLAIHTDMNAAERKARVIELFKTVRIDNPERRYHAYPNQMSGGQRQRVMIAMALAMNTKLLIADEPTTALDVTVQGEILKLLKELQKKFKLSVLFITHDFGVVEALGDRVVVMQHGNVMEEGTVKSVMSKPKDAYTKKLLAAMPKFKPHAPFKGKKNALLKVTDMRKVFNVRKGGLFSKPEVFEALKGVSFEMYKGETLGVVGESGCGKSTLARCIIGLYQPDGGEAIFKGENIATQKGKGLKETRRHMQMVFQDPFSSLNPRMRIGESVAEGLRAHNIMPAAERETFVKQLLKDCGLPEDSYDRYPHQFSGGQRQRICIARALSLKPDLIIADEPVSALDVSVQKQILALFQDLKKKYNLSYVFISHDLRVVSEICERVLVMQGGEIVEQGNTKDVFLKPKHAYTKHLLSSIPGTIGKTSSGKKAS